MNAWDTDELDAMLAAEPAPPAPPDWIVNYPTRGPRLLRGITPASAPRRRPAPPPPARRWPDGAASIPVLRPAAPSAAWMAQVRAMRRAGLISRDEARAYLGLPPLSRWAKVWREVRRYRVVWR